MNEHKDCLDTGPFTHPFLVIRRDLNQGTNWRKGFMLRTDANDYAAKMHVSEPGHDIEVVEVLAIYAGGD